jgi:hypothetical protein
VFCVPGRGCNPLDLITLGANVVFAHITFPPGRQEPATPLRGTLAYKLLFHRGWVPFQIELFSFERIESQLKSRNLVTNSYSFHFDASNFSSTCEFWLGIWKKTLFTFKENLFAVFFEFTVSKLFCTRVIDEFTVPCIFAIHAVRIIDDAYEKLLNAVSARFVFAVRARDCDS